MAAIRKSKMKEMSENDINQNLRELRIDLSREKATSEIGGSMKSPGKVKEIKRTIARLLTRKNMLKMKGGKKK